MLIRSTKLLINLMVMIVLWLNYKYSSLQEGVSFG